MVGCGSVGQGLLPLLFRTFFIRPELVTIIAADEAGKQVAELFGVRHFVEPVTPENYSVILSRHLGIGDLLLNLSVDVSSIALMTWCKPQGVLYLDTCVEPWSGGYQSKHLQSPETSNAWLRQQALSLHTPGAPTAVIAHGMNPGLISHLLKEALLALACRKNLLPDAIPAWGALAKAMGVKAVHISERDTQDDGRALQHGEFANTWSAHGLYSEAWLQKAEMGWGSHEQDVPSEATIQGRILCLKQNGAAICLRTWLPTLGEQLGMLVTHHEVISITEMLTDGSYCPTVCYVYNPCPKAKESLENLHAGIPATDFRVLSCDEIRGFDEVGVLLIHDTGALWHGAMLTSDDARRHVSYNSATSLQVVAGIVGAITWMLEHPRCGVVEAEHMDSQQVLAVARPYLGKVTTVETEWCSGRSHRFDEFLQAVDAQTDKYRLYSRATNAEEVGI